MRRFAEVPVAPILFTVAVVAGTVVPSQAAEAERPPAVAYRPPVDAPVTDRFRPPATEYGPGNRGIDYATAPGQPVTSAADGEVTFAAAVAGSIHVVVLHNDGIRTSYSFLATAEVRRGDKVRSGDQVGTAGGSGLHFGARAGEEYLDPLGLLGAGAAARVRLVDDDDRRPLTEVVERRWLLEGLPLARRFLTDAATRAWDKAVAKFDSKVGALRIVIDGLTDLWIPIPFHLAVAAARWEESQATCTPAETPVPPPAHNPERVVILVAGLASRTGDATVLDVDTSALGYQPTNVHQFSYREDGRNYDADDTQGDLAEAGRRLARMIAAVQRAHPGVAVDVIAHSQGGLVARSAVTRNGATPATLVTLATPHDGTELASAAAGLDASTNGRRLLDVAGALPLPIDPNSTSVLQMSETSPFLRDLRDNGRWPPPFVTYAVSIGARGDPIVPSHHTRLAGVPSIVVTPEDAATIADHETLPGSPEATVEIARALARQAPTCRSLMDSLLDEMTSRQAADAQDRAALALIAAGFYSDYRTARSARSLR